MEMEHKLIDIDYNLYKIDNGMRLLLIPNSSATIISYGVKIMIGSLNENDNELGVAHFLEHMMFKGSKRFPGNKLIDMLDKYGASYNASTTYGSTDYYIHGLPQYHRDLLTILLDMFYNPQIPDESVENEKKIILQEYSMRRNSNYYKQYINLIKMATKERHTIYGRPIIGTIDSINNITTKQLNKFRKKYNNANRMIIISGQFDLNDTLQMLKEIHTELNNKDIIITRDETKLQEYINDKMKLSLRSNKEIKLSIRYVFEKISKGQTLILLSFPCWKLFHENNEYLGIFSSILTDGMSGRITKVLRETHGLSYSQSSYIDTFNEFGFFHIKTAVETETVYLAIKIILDVLIECYENGITEYELSKTKNYNLMDILIHYQKQMSYFSLFTEELMRYYKVKRIDEIIKKYNSIKKEDIHKIIKKVINPKQLYISIVGPRELCKNEIKQLFNYFKEKIK